MAALSRSEYMSPKELASHFGVTVTTIRKWIKAGKIETQQPAGFRGRQFIKRNDFEGANNDRKN